MIRPSNTSESSHWALADDLYSVSSTRGLYSPMQFVVRLRQDYHELLSSGRTGVLGPGDVSVEKLFAFSTFFHETVHWWQHIGSTTGLMLTLAYPAQCHVNHPYLLNSLREFGPRKSLLSFLKAGYGKISDEPRKDLNRIINNWHDVEFNRRIILDPVRIKTFVDNPIFECVGHSLEMGLSQTLWLLSTIIDPNLEFLPDIRRWEDGFAELRNKKVQGYYYRSDVSLVPLGALKIFEGQARFSQMQYLYLASGESATWENFDAWGMMGDTYIAAFELFLKWTELEWPDSPIHSTVLLFLLVCDLAINPSDGYPFDIHHYESFIVSDDPSFRFAFLCRTIAKKPQLKNAIKRCTREEFLEVSTVLCRALGCRQPVEIAAQILTWREKSDRVRTILDEDSTFNFQNENLPVRLCLARHLRFAEDRVMRPEFFCWPGIHFVGSKHFDPDLDASSLLWARHQPLFMASIDGEIRPTLLPGRAEANIYQTFNNFYSWNVLYDLVRQWIVTDGPFNYDYTWLTSRYTPEIVKPWVSQTFERTFHIGLTDFESKAGIGS